MAITAGQPARVAHPLEPLMADEVAAAVAILRAECRLGERVRFMSVALHEPPKQVVRDFKPGDAVDRAAFVVLLDNQDGKTYEAVVSLSAGRVTSWEHIPNVQPAITIDEFMECEAACKADAEWQAAMRKRGVADFDLCMVDPWSNGNYGIAEEEGRRLVRALTWLRASPRDNG